MAVDLKLLNDLFAVEDEHTYCELDSLLSTLQASVRAFRAELALHGLPPPSSRRVHPLE
jgi:hypothetical protein